MTKKLISELSNKEKDVQLAILHIWIDTALDIIPTSMYMTINTAFDERVSKITERKVGNGK
jgi:hypothetical protein